MDLSTTAETLLTRFDAVMPADLDETLALNEERGWVRALQHLSQRGMLTPEGQSEAARIVAEIAEWADELETDGTESPCAEAPRWSDTPSIVPCPTEQ